MSYLVVSRNGEEQAVAYPEGEYPTVEAAVQAALYLRRQYPAKSRVVNEGWYTVIEVVATDGKVTSPQLYTF